MGHSWNNGCKFNTNFGLHK